MAGGVASQKKIEIAERRAKAMELRKMGANYRQIAEKIANATGNEKYSHVHAFKDVTAALREIRESTQESAIEFRELECQRLDIAQLAIAQQVKKGNLGAIDRWIRIMERRARLLGLDIDDLNRAWHVIEAHGYERIQIPEGYKLVDAYAENQAEGEAEEGEEAG